MLASTYIIAWVPGPMELAIIAIIALVFFGRRLPDVAKSMGKSIVEFKKGLKDVKDDMDTAGTPDDVRKALPPNEDANKENSST